jgi:hypothetical protein
MKLLANLPFLALGFSATAIAAPVCSVDYTITNTSDKETYFTRLVFSLRRAESYVPRLPTLCRTDCDT